MTIECSAQDIVSLKQSPTNYKSQASGEVLPGSTIIAQNRSFSINVEGQAIVAPNSNGEVGYTIFTGQYDINGSLSEAWVVYVYQTDEGKLAISNYKLTTPPTERQTITLDNPEGNLDNSIFFDKDHRTITITRPRQEPVVMTLTHPLNNSPYITMEIDGKNGSIDLKSMKTRIDADPDMIPDNFAPPKEYAVGEGLAIESARLGITMSIPDFNRRVPFLTRFWGESHKFYAI